MKRKSLVEKIGRKVFKGAFKVHDAAALLGQLGGRSTSAAKAAAARENGSRGGRPRLADGVKEKNRAERRLDKQVERENQRQENKDARRERKQR